MTKEQTSYELMDKCVKDKNFKIRDVEWADDDYIYYDTKWLWSDETPMSLNSSDIFNTYGWEEYEEQDELPNQYIINILETEAKKAKANMEGLTATINKRDFEIGDLVTQNIKHKKRIRKLESALKLTVENLKAVESILEVEE